MKYRLLKEKLKKYWEPIKYYHLLNMLLKIHEYRCPEVFRLYLEEIKGYKEVRKIVIVGGNEFFLRLADSISEDNRIEVVLVCDINDKRTFVVNQLLYDFDIQYVSTRKIKNIKADCYIVDKVYLGLSSEKCVSANNMIKEIIEKGIAIRSGIDALCQYYERLGVRAFKVEIPSINTTDRVIPFGYLKQNDINNFFKGMQTSDGKADSALYYEELSRCIVNSPPPVRKGRLIEFSDYRSSLINRIGGERIIENSPQDYEYTIHILGRCTADSSHTDDKHTIAYQLQKLILENDKIGKIPRVCAKGLPAVDWSKVIKNCYNLSTIKKGDMVFILCDRIYLSKVDVHTHQEFKKTKYSFYDGCEHCTHIGYGIYAKCIYDFWKTQKNNSPQVGKMEASWKKAFFGNEDLQKYLNGLDNYIIENKDKKTIGSIVMNCNPFTLGHLHLIKTALQKVDWLYIFVVEENKSEFSFKDRINLVRDGIKDLERITVIPSGKFIISSITFPQYFTKGASPNVKVDTSLDAQVFGEYIAPALNIKSRFLGEEPKDMITNQYNNMLKNVLPQYGIRVEVVKRLKNKNEDIISASAVRKALKENEWETIEEMVPKSTYVFLRNRQ